MSANNKGKVYRSAVLIQIGGNRRPDADDSLEFRIDLNNRKIEEKRAPEFIVKPRRQFIDEGQPAIFKMSFEGSPDTDVSWTVNGQPVKNDSNYQIYEKDGFHFLEIENVSPSDKGKYECTVENSSGSATVSADLEVFVKSSPLDKKIQGPTLVQPLKDLLVVEGDRNVVIDCRVSGATRDCCAAWFKDGNEIKHGREFRMKFDNRVASLTISETLEEDNGHYECVISGAFGELRTDCSITVEASNEQHQPPVFVRELHDMEVDNGDKVELVVEVKGSEPIHVFWILNNREILPDDLEYAQITEDNTHKLIISRVYQQDAGEYVCEAYNDYGDTDTFCRLQVRDVNIPFAPDFITKPRIITVDEGSDAMFSCQVRGQPTPTVQWEHNGLAVTDGGKYKQSCQGDEHILEIFDVTEEDTGKYLCRLSNSCGVTLHSTSLLIKEAGSDTTDFRSLLKSRPTIGKIGKQTSLSSEKTDREKEQIDFRQLLTRRQSSPLSKTVEKTELQQHDFRNVLKNMGDKSEKPSLLGLQSMKSKNMGDKSEKPSLLGLQSKKKTLHQTENISSVDTKQIDFRNNLKKTGNISNRITSLEAPKRSNSAMITGTNGRRENCFETKTTSVTNDRNSSGRKSFEGSENQKFESGSKQLKESKLFKKFQSSGNIHEKGHFVKDSNFSSSNLKNENIHSTTLPRTKEIRSLKERLDKFETSPSQKFETKPHHGFATTLPRNSKMSVKDKLNKFELSSSTENIFSNFQNVSKSHNSLAAYANETRDVKKPSEQTSTDVNEARNTFTDSQEYSKPFSSKWQPKINWKKEVKKIDRSNEGKVEVAMVELLPSNTTQKVNKQVEVSMVELLPSNATQKVNKQVEVAMVELLPSNATQKVNKQVEVAMMELLPSNATQKVNKQVEVAMMELLPSNTTQKVNKQVEVASVELLPSNATQKVNKQVEVAMMELLPSNTTQKVNKQVEVASVELLPSNTTQKVNKQVEVAMVELLPSNATQNVNKQVEVASVELLPSNTTQKVNKQVEVAMVELLPSNATQKVNKQVEVASVELLPSNTTQKVNKQVEVGMVEVLPSNATQKVNKQELGKSNKTGMFGNIIAVKPVPEKTFKKSAIVNPFEQNLPKTNISSVDIGVVEPLISENNLRKTTQNSSRTETLPLDIGVVEPLASENLLKQTTTQNCSRTETLSVDFGGIKSIASEEDLRKSKVIEPREQKSNIQHSSSLSLYEQRLLQKHNNSLINAGTIDPEVPEKNCQKSAIVSPHEPKYPTKTELSSDRSLYEYKSPKQIKESSINVCTIEPEVPEKNFNKSVIVSPHEPKYPTKTEFSSDRSQYKSPKQIKDSSANVGGIEPVVAKTSFKKSAISSQNEQIYSNSALSQLELKSPNRTESLIPEKKLSKSKHLFEQHSLDAESKMNSNRNPSDKISKLTKFAALEVKVPVKAQQVDFRNVLNKQTDPAVSSHPPRARVVPQPQKAGVVSPPKPEIILQAQRSETVPLHSRAGVVSPQKAEIILQAQRSDTVPLHSRAGVVSPQKAEIILQAQRSDTVPLHSRAGVVSPQKAEIILQAQRSDTAPLHSRAGVVSPQKAEIILQAQRSDTVPLHSRAGVVSPQKTEIILQAQRSETVSLQSRAEVVSSQKAESILHKPREVSSPPRAEILPQRQRSPVVPLYSTDAELPQALRDESALKTPTAELFSQKSRQAIVSSLPRTKIDILPSGHDVVQQPSTLEDFLSASKNEVFLILSKTEVIPQLSKTELFLSPSKSDVFLPPKATVVPQPPRAEVLQEPARAKIVPKLPRAVLQEPPRDEIVPQLPKAEIVQEPARAKIVPKLPRAEVLQEPPRDEIVPKLPRAEVLQEPPRDEIVPPLPKAEIVQEPPRVKMNLCDQRVKYGDKAVLECQITGDRVHWSVNGKEVTSRLVRMNYDAADVASLMIAEVYSEDEGDYTVMATNKFGSASSTCHLSVDSSSTLSSKSDIEGSVTFPARIISLISNPDTIVRGDALEIKAVTTGEPLPEVRWFRGKREIKPDGRIEFESSMDTYILRICDVTSNDAGRYTVVSENHAGTDQASLSVQVEDTPEPPIGKPQITAVVRSSVTLSWYGPAYDGGSQVLYYQIEGRKVKEDSWIVYTSSCKSTFFQIDDLAANTSYVFRVSAGNKHGFSCPGDQSDEILTENRLQSSSDYESDGTLEVFLPANVTPDDELPFEPREVKISPNRILEDHYEVLHEVGRGKFGNVYQCKAKDTGKIWAAKIVKCREKDKANVRHEIEIMNLLAHPKLLLLWDAFEAPRKMILVMEYIGGGELFERVSSDDFCLTERDCVHFMRQICCGVAYMHSKGVLHLDLKPENILCIDKGSNLIKIIDFGLARRFNEGESIKVMFGTPEFIAPEVVNYDEIDFATDMWSLGVICYVLLSGLSPFMGDSDSETLSNVTLGEYDFDEESFDDISDNAKDFIQHLLLKNKQKRSTIRECQKHIWLAQDERRIRLKRLNTEKLKRFMARRKWQKTGTAIRALGRMASLQRLVSSSSISSGGSSSMDMRSPGSCSNNSPGFHSLSSMSFNSNTFSPPTYKVQEEEGDVCTEPISMPREVTQRHFENQPNNLSEKEIIPRDIEKDSLNFREREIDQRNDKSQLVEFSEREVNQRNVEIVEQRDTTHEKENVNVFAEQTTQEREITQRNIEQITVNPKTLDRETEQTHIFKAVPTMNVCQRETTLSSNSSLACSEPNNELNPTLQQNNGHINNGFNTDLETTHLRPKFVKKMVDCQAFKGDVVRFDVKVAGDPCPQISWYHEDDLVFQDHRHLVEIGGDGQCSLIIRKVCEEDEGEYSAKAVSSCGDASCSAELIICGSGAF